MRHNATKVITHAFALFTIAILLFAAVAPLVALAWSPGDPIVPQCNITERSGGQIKGLTTPCTFCHLLELIQNLLNYMWWVVTPTVLTIALIYGGGLMFVSSTQGNTALAERGKKIIGHALLGVVLVFGAWIMIDTFIKALGGKIGSNTASDGFGPWNQITCVAPETSTQMDTTTITEAIGVTPQKVSAPICNAILKNPSISWGSADCKGLLTNEPVGPKTTITECSNLRPPTVCGNGCDNKPVCQTQTSIVLNQTMLAAIETLGRERSFTLSSITTGSHTPNSCHYNGNCVDVIPASKTKEEMEKLRARMIQLGAKQSLCETKELNPNTKKNTWLSCYDVPSNFTFTHIHANF